VGGLLLASSWRLQGWGLLRGEVLGLSLTLEAAPLWVSPALDIEVDLNIGIAGG
jgi:hypothetical protein